MSIFLGFAVGIVLGACLGSIGMFLYIKETAYDAVFEREAKEEYNSSFRSRKRKLEVSGGVEAPELDDEELEMPRRV